MSSSSNNISTSYADLSLFAILTPPTLYILYSHGRSGLLGWSMLFLFCNLRLIGAGLAVASHHNAHPSKGATVIQSIGLSPLILACAGVAAELWHYAVESSELGETNNGRRSNPQPSFAKRMLKTPAHLLHLTIHVLVLTGVTLSASSASNLSSSTASSDSSKRSSINLYKTGSILFLVSWILLLAFVIYTIHAFWSRRATISPSLSSTSTPIFTRLLALVLGRSSHGGESSKHEPALIAARLAVPVSIATCLAGERTVYAVFVAFSKEGFSRLATSKQGEKWLFTWADVAWAAVFLVAGGLWTRGLGKARRENGLGARDEQEEEEVGLRTVSKAGAEGTGATRGAYEG